MEFDTFERSHLVQELNLGFQIGSTGYMGLIVIRLDPLPSGSIAWDFLLAQGQFTLAPDWYVETKSVQKGPGGMFGSKTTQRIVYVPRGLTQDDTNAALFMMLRPLISTMDMLAQPLWLPNAESASHDNNT